MVMATLQRVKEIGTMRAIGTQRRFVVAMLLVEIATVGVVFGARRRGARRAAWCGVIRAAGGIPATTDHALLRLLGPGAPPAARRARGRRARSRSCSLVAILSALYPALLAMRVTPVEAMATED